MENRKAFDLKGVLIFYNFGVVALSLYMVYEVRLTVFIGRGVTAAEMTICFTGAGVGEICCPLDKVKLPSALLAESDPGPRCHM